MANSQEALDLLRSIDASLKLLVRQQVATAPKAVASDRDLDGQYGNPLLRFDHRDWTGPSCKGRRFSECPPELLDLVADSFDYFARKADENNEVTSSGKPKGDFNRADAARARGWAKRIRDGHYMQREPVAAGASEWAGNDDSFN